MQNAISIYNFNENQVRAQLINGEPWFCLSDCCKALNIKNQQTSVKLPENGVGKTYLIDSMGRQQSATFINEPNLYRLIFRSNKPQAQAFADWVYSEVLPSIRKTGGYGVPSLTNDRATLKAIGGIVKKCAAVAVREEVAKLFSSSSDTAEPWEVSDTYLMQVLHDWHLTRNKGDVVKMQELIQENEEYKRRLSAIKQAII